MWMRRLFVVALIAGGSFVFAQEVRVPYQLGLDIGYIGGYADAVYFCDADTCGTGVESTGNGNTRIAADAIVNMGRRKRFGLGLAYRRIAPDTGYALNTVGPIISRTMVRSRSFVTVFSLSGGYAAVNFDDYALDESVFGSTTYGSSIGFYAELQWKLAFPIIELTEMSATRRLNLAPHVSIAAGGAIAFQDVSFGNSSFFPDDDYELSNDTAYASVAIGATLMVLDTE